MDLMSSQRFPQVKKFASPQDLRARIAELDLGIPIEDTIDSTGVLASSFVVNDGSAGSRTVGNRFTILPMEGWDGTTSGGSTELVKRRWNRFGAGGAKIVWAEATAVVATGRANPHQLVMNPSTVDDIAGLRRGLVAAHQERFDTAEDLLVGLQLTHSGRWSRPEGVPAPRTAHRIDRLESRTPAGAIPLTDEDLDELVTAYVDAAMLARQAGFDFVDIKHCHGYLLHELLAARDRPGPYGTTFEGRTFFLRQVVERLRAEVPDLAIGVRLSAFDFSPFEPGRGRVGIPSLSEDAGAFGGDGTGTGVDLTETFRFIDLCRDFGIGLLSITAGSPYYNPHIQRPAYFPPSDGYLPPEDPLVGVARVLTATAEIQRRYPDLAVVTGAMSYLQDFFANCGQALINSGAATSIGLGRMALSYPHLPLDVLEGRPLDRHLVCRTLSDCTTAPRNGLISGCFPLDEFYKQRPERAQLAIIKRELRAEGT